MSFISLKTAIKNKLDTLKGDDQPLVEVYDEHTTELAGFPCATFEPSDLESDFETTTQNFRRYIFRLVIHQEMGKVGRGEAVRILAQAIDLIIDAFDQDYSLGGACNFCNATPSMFGEYETAKGIIKFAEIKLVCNKAVSIIP